MWVHGTVYTNEYAWKDPGLDNGWARDITIENAPLTTTGGHVWNAAYRLFHYFEEKWDEIMYHVISFDHHSVPLSDCGITVPRPLCPRRRPLRVLELGAGCGWLGMALARNLPQDICRMCMTEQVVGGALDWLQHNVRINQEIGLSLHSVDTSPCDWNDYISLLEHKAEDSSITPAVDTSLASVSWDLIIGSDLVYNRAGTMMLPKVMRALSNKGTLIYYAHTRKRYEVFDIEFFEELEKKWLYLGGGKRGHCRFTTCISTTIDRGVSMDEDCCLQNSIV